MMTWSRPLTTYPARGTRSKARFWAICIASAVTGPRGSSGPGCGSWFVVDGRAGVGCWGCRVQRVGAVPLLVEVVARRDRFTAVDGSLLLQTGGLCRVDIRFGLGGASFGGGLVGEGFLLIY